MSTSVFFAYHNFRFTRRLKLPARLAALNAG
jgi:hypothetical protein